MNSFTKPALLVCLGLAAPVVSHPAVAATIDEISARFDALEKENAALRARVNRLEASKAAAIRRRPADAAPGPALVSLPRSQNADAQAADLSYSPGIPRPNSPRFEIGGSLLFLQPGAGNLEYATLVNPLPAASPNWANQSLTPNFAPAFSVAARYMANESNDIEVDWTHLRSTANASVVASPTQMIGPPYSIGPEAGLYKLGFGTVQSSYDAVNLDAGHTFCAECSFQLRAFGGVEFARIGQNLTGMFQSPDGLAASANTTNSLFTGAGPRLGIKGQYALGDFQFIGEVAGAALIGTSKSSINFSTTSPSVGINNQALTSPDATRVIPSIDARLATAYTFPAGNYGLFRVEAGYRAAVYFDVINQYALTQVPTSLMLPPVGIFLATQQHVQSSFTDQGPYLKASWLFW
jgi:hypothetical protein